MPIGKKGYGKKAPKRMNKGRTYVIGNGYQKKK